MKRTIRFVGWLGAALIPGSLAVGLPAWAAWRWWKAREGR